MCLKIQGEIEDIELFKKGKTSRMYSYIMNMSNILSLLFLYYYILCNYLLMIMFLYLC